MAQDPLNLVCVEPYFPGRLGWIADWLVRRRGYRIHFFTHQADPAEFWPESVGKGLELIQFNVGGVAREPSVSWLKSLERGLCYAYGAWEVYDSRRPRPIDAILGRSAGLGSNLFGSVAYPGIPRVNLFDYWYRAHHFDLAGEAGLGMPDEYYLWRRAINGMDLLDLENDVVPLVPTNWQHSLYPDEYRDDMTVIYDGVDSRRFTRPAKRPEKILGRPLPPHMKLVTFVASAPDWLRGLDRFIALANRLLRAREDVMVVIVGGGPVARMLDVRFHGKDYLQICLGNDPPPDAQRFLILGLTAPNTVAEVLGASDLHVYPAREYVVARPMVEAMSSAAVVMAWDTAPVREFIDHERTGFLVPGDDMDAAEKRALEILDDPAKYRSIGEAAAAEVREKFSQDACLPELCRLLDRLAATAHV